MIRDEYDVYVTYIKSPLSIEVSMHIVHTNDGDESEHSEPLAELIRDCAALDEYDSALDNLEAVGFWDVVDQVGSEGDYGHESELYGQAIREFVSGDTFLELISIILNDDGVSDGIARVTGATDMLRSLDDSLLTSSF